MSKVPKLILISKVKGIKLSQNQNKRIVIKNLSKLIIIKPNPYWSSKIKRFKQKNIRTSKNRIKIKMPNLNYQNLKLPKKWNKCKDKKCKGKKIKFKSLKNSNKVKKSSMNRRKKYKNKEKTKIR